MKPVVCCSIIVSVLRVRDMNAQGPISDLLFDPILLNYGGEAMEYLKRIPATDPAHGPVQNALSMIEHFYADLDRVGMIKELHPSDYQRDVVHQRTHDEMRLAHKMAESESVLWNFVHRSTILYGKRTLTYVTDPQGQQRAVAIDLQPFSKSVELPRREIVDPVGLNYVLRLYRAEKLK